MKKTIGKSLDYGFAGNYAQDPDLVIATEILKGETPVYFGEAVQLSDEGVTAIKEDFASAKFVGIAASEIRSTPTVDTMDGVYREDNPASILTRGVISVICQKGEPKRGGEVFLRVKNGTDELKVGRFEAGPTSEDLVKVENAVWTTDKDGNDIATLRLRTINLV